MAWYELNWTTTTVLVIAVCAIGYALTGGRFPSDRQGGPNTPSMSNFPGWFQEWLNRRGGNHGD